MGPLYRAYIKKKYGNGGLIEDWTQPNDGSVMWDDGQQGNYLGAVPETSQETQTNTGGSSFNTGAVISTGANVAADYINSTGKPLGQYENYKAGSQETKYAGSGALKGAATGFSVGGVWGALAGAVIGGVGGFIKGRKMEKKRTEEVGKLNQAYLRDVQQQQQFDAFKNQNYFKDSRQAQMYEYGGSLYSNFMANQKALGGNLIPTSSSTTEVRGQSHEQGGVQLPYQQAEVEGGETLAKDYVFSKELGFAKLHRPIAKAKGKIEGKPATVERLSALRQLERKENNLRLAQEYFKQQLNLV